METSQPQKFSRETTKLRKYHMLRRHRQLSIDGWLGSESYRWRNQPWMQPALVIREWRSSGLRFLRSFTLLTNGWRKYPLMARLDYGIPFCLHTCIFFGGILHLFHYTVFHTFWLEMLHFDWTTHYLILNNYKTIASQSWYLISRLHSWIKQ